MYKLEKSLGRYALGPSVTFSLLRGISSKDLRARRAAGVYLQLLHFIVGLEMPTKNPISDRDNWIKNYTKHAALLNVTYVL